MATSIESGGYKCRFVDAPDILRCYICQYVSRQPQQHGECGTLFCLSCITDYKKTSNDCPHCRQELSTRNDGKSCQDVKDLKVECDYVDNGCDWVGELRSIEQHIRTCTYCFVLCPNECDNVVIQKDLDNHLSNTCPKRQYKCPHCEDVGEYWEITTDHLDTCPMVEVKCTNDKCKVRVLRQDLSDHCTICEYRLFPCKFAEFGCTETKILKHLSKHEQDESLHLQMTKETVVELKEQLKEQREMFLRLQQEREQRAKEEREKLSAVEEKLQQQAKGEREKLNAVEEQFEEKFLELKEKFEQQTKETELNISLQRTSLQKNIDEPKRRSKWYI